MLTLTIARPEAANALNDERRAFIEAVLSGVTRRDGACPANTGGGLVGYGHPTGATGVRMAVDLWKQLTGKAGGFQVNVAKEHGVMVSMGGNDKTVVSLVVRR